MLRLCLLIMTFLSIIGSGQAKPQQSADYKKVIQEQARAMGKFLVNKDVRSFTKFTYPKIAEMAGDADSMIAAMEKDMKEAEAQGIYILDVTIGEPSKVLTSGSELQCTLEETIEMKIPDGRLIVKSTLIAISSDKGKNWFFLDAPGPDIQQLQKKLPNLSADLIIPERPKPVFVSDKAK